MKNLIIQNIMTNKQEEKLLNSTRYYQNKLVNALYLAEIGKLKNENDKNTFLGDLHDHLKLCSLILEKKYSKASRFLWDLDTIPRESVPFGIYNKIANYEENKKI